MDNSTIPITHVLFNHTSITRVCTETGESSKEGFIGSLVNMLMGIRLYGHSSAKGPGFK
ncbi:hypothetical protein HAX54_030482, partial [Datura stramonium]|nr:hypothetical protein [Datura stramonium]